jgi:hypothetical protein
MVATKSIRALQRPQLGSTEWGRDAASKRTLHADARSVCLPHDTRRHGCNLAVRWTLRWRSCGYRLEFVCIKVDVGSDSPVD